MCLVSLESSNSCSIIDDSQKIDTRPPFEQYANFMKPGWIQDIQRNQAECSILIQALRLQSSRNNLPTQQIVFLPTLNRINFKAIGKSWEYFSIFAKRPIQVAHYMIFISL